MTTSRFRKRLDPMFPITVAFANLLLAALTVGAMFGVWLGLDPRGLAAEAWVAQQQRAVAGMNVAVPALGFATIGLTLLLAFVAHDQALRVVLVASAACFVVAGLVTRLSNQPINAVVMSWPVDSPPQGWELLRDRRWQAHVVRTAAGVGGLCLLIGATLGVAAP